jgi:hypothetical protein
MPYKVVPFNANIMAGEGANKAAAQLEALISSQSSDGWRFHGIETLQTTVVTPAKPGSNGCMGIGAVPGHPESRANAAIYVAVFEKS